MNRFLSYCSKNSKQLAAIGLILAGLAALMLYRLGSLTQGMSSVEIQTAVYPVGWHGIFNQPFDLPLKIIRSGIFKIAPGHGAMLTRLPNVAIGSLAVISFGWLVWIWHGPRVAILTTLLFATSAWTLHASRLASNDVLYLWAMPALLLTHTWLQQTEKRAYKWYLSLFIWGIALYIPGMIWLIVFSVFFQRRALLQGWQELNSWWKKLVSIVLIIGWLPLLIINLLRPGQFKLWLGTPHVFASPLHIVKEFFAVFIHLFVRGPQYPNIWLAKAPILDIFTLAMCGIGIYFYCRHWQSRRSRLLSGIFLIGVLLIAVSGPVGLSLLVPLLYVIAGTGVAYILREWLKVFPVNPVARGAGISLVTLAVVISCMYNVRAYYVAWPHNYVTQATFSYHRP